MVILDGLINSWSHDLCRLKITQGSYNCQPVGTENMKTVVNWTPGKRSTIFLSHDHEHCAHLRLS